MAHMAPRIRRIEQVCPLNLRSHSIDKLNRYDRRIEFWKDRRIVVAPSFFLLLLPAEIRPRRHGGDHPAAAPLRGPVPAPARSRTPRRPRKNEVRRICSTRLGTPRAVAMSAIAFARCCQPAERGPDEGAGGPPMYMAPVDSDCVSVCSLDAGSVFGASSSGAC